MAKYFTISHGLRGCYMPDGDPYIVMARTRRELKAAIADEANGLGNIGRPFLGHHHYRHGQGKDSVTYTPLADRERGALKRLDKIMARYPGFASYVQTDPRGCSLYILPPALLARYPDGANGDVGSFYSSGIAVCK
jgi:hypothetical protein